MPVFTLIATCSTAVVYHMIRHTCRAINTRSFFYLGSIICGSTRTISSGHFQQLHTNLNFLLEHVRLPHSSPSLSRSGSSLKFHSTRYLSSIQEANKMADARYCVEYAKTGRSSCKKCKSQIEKGVARIGKITANPFSDDGGEMKVWYHTRCMFETLKVC